MKNLADLLKNFKSRFFSEESKREELRKILFEKTKIDFDSKSLEIKGRTLFIKNSSILKNEVFLRKRDVLEEISSRLGKGVVDEIV